MNRGLMADCKSNGYKIAFEGAVSDEGGKGYFIPITIVDNPPDDARIVREERKCIVIMPICAPLTGPQNLDPSSHC